MEEFVWKSERVHIHDKTTLTILVEATDRQARKAGMDMLLHPGRGVEEGGAGALSGV